MNLIHFGSQPHTYTCLKGISLRNISKRFEISSSMVSFHQVYILYKISIQNLISPIKMIAFSYLTLIQITKLQTQMIYAKNVRQKTIDNFWTTLMGTQFCYLLWLLLLLLLLESLARQALEMHFSTRLLIL